MTTRTYAAWVEPIAADLRESRARVVRTARSLAPEHWSIPSPLPGWTCKDVLAHLAGDSEKISSELMRATIERRPIAHPHAFDDNGVVANARDVERRRDAGIDELIAEIKSDSEQWQDMLSHLDAAAETTRWDGFPMSLGDYLRIVAGHDHDHCAEIETALARTMR